MRVVDWNSPEALDLRVQGYRGASESLRSYSPPAKRSGSTESMTPDPWQTVLTPLINCLGNSDPWKAKAEARARQLREEAHM